MVPTDVNLSRARRVHAIEALVVGASAGAVGALERLLPALRAGSTVPVVIVVHLPADKPSLLVELFRPRCALPVREAGEKEPVDAGIWFAPPGYHLLIERDRTFALSVDEPVHFSRPSIDVLFESAADVYRSALACAVLTGANDDGAFGAKHIRDHGGFVMVQDPTAAEADAMPRAAIAKANPQWVGSITEMTALLARICCNGELG
jgi:two-component system chemotaxis response regulator CheB